jgi:hypothetical protein
MVGEVVGAGMVISPAEEMEGWEGRHRGGRICGGEERAADGWEGTAGGEGERGDNGIG